MDDEPESGVIKACRVATVACPNAAGGVLGVSPIILIKSGLSGKQHFADFEGLGCATVGGTSRFELYSLAII
jgi:hypothetical protein